MSKACFFWKLLERTREQKEGILGRGTDSSIESSEPLGGKLEDLREADTQGALQSLVYPGGSLPWWFRHAAKFENLCSTAMVLITYKNHCPPPHLPPTPYSLQETLMQQIWGSAQESTFQTSSPSDPDAGGFKRDLLGVS